MRYIDLQKILNKYNAGKGGWRRAFGSYSIHMKFLKEILDNSNQSRSENKSVDSGRLIAEEALKVYQYLKGLSSKIDIQSGTLSAGERAILSLKEKFSVHLIAYEAICDSVISDDERYGDLSARYEADFSSDFYNSVFYKTLSSSKKLDSISREDVRSFLEKLTHVYSRRMKRTSIPAPYSDLKASLLPILTVKGGLETERNELVRQEMKLEIREKLPQLTEEFLDEHPGKLAYLADICRFCDVGLNMDSALVIVRLPDDDELFEFIKKNSRDVPVEFKRLNAIQDNKLLARVSKALMRLSYLRPRISSDILLVNMALIYKKPELASSYLASYSMLGDDVYSSEAKCILDWTYEKFLKIVGNDEKQQIVRGRALNNLISKLTQIEDPFEWKPDGKEKIRCHSKDIKNIMNFLAKNSQHLINFEQAFQWARQNIKRLVVTLEPGAINPFGVLVSFSFNLLERFPSRALDVMQCCFYYQVDGSSHNRISTEEVLVKTKTHVALVAQGLSLLCEHKLHSKERDALVMQSGEEGLRMAEALVMRMAEALVMIEEIGKKTNGEFKCFLDKELEDVQKDSQGWRLHAALELAEEKQLTEPVVEALSLLPDDDRLGDDFIKGYQFLKDNKVILNRENLMYCSEVAYVIGEKILTNKQITALWKKPFRAASHTWLALSLLKRHLVFTSLREKFKALISRLLASPEKNNMIALGFYMLFKQENRFEVWQRNGLDSTVLALINNPGRTLIDLLPIKLDARYYKSGICQREYNELMGMIDEIYAMKKAGIDVPEDVSKCIASYLSFDIKIMPSFFKRYSPSVFSGVIKTEVAAEAKAAAEKADSGDEGASCSLLTLPSSS